MIALRTYGSDSNPSGASAFVGIPTPIGVKDGDLILVGITLPATGITVTPPSSDWTQLTQTDKAVALGLIVFWKFALNEGADWVFALSSSINAVGGCAVYANADGFEPVESFASLLSPSGASAHPVPSVSTALDAEELVVFLAGTSTTGGHALGSGYHGIVIAHQTNASFEIFHKLQPNAGVVPQVNSNYSINSLGAEIQVVLRPSAGVHSIDAVRDRVIGALPRGVDRVYDLTPNQGDYDKYFRSVATLFKYYGFDQIDLLRLEVNPAQSIYKLPDWERIFGLETTKTAKRGTIPDRQKQVVAAWRIAAGQGSSIPEIQAAVAPVLGYSDPSTVQIMETSRSSLLTAHTYTAAGAPFSIPGPGSVAIHFHVLDDPAVSEYGANIAFGLTTTAKEDISATLVGPPASGGRPQASLSFPPGYLGSGSVTAISQTLWGKAAAGCTIRGTWTLTLTSSAAAGTVTFAEILVEAIGRNTVGQGLAAPAYEWGVYVDPTLVNHGAGGAVDYDGLLRLIQPFAQSHTVAEVIRASVLDGVAEAIPDDANCIPNQCIPS